MFDSLYPHGLLHTRLLCPPVFPRVCSNSCLLSWWCSPAISSSATCFCLQFFSLSQQQGLFQWVACLHQVVRVLELQLQLNYKGTFYIKIKFIILVIVLSIIFWNLFCYIFWCLYSDVKYSFWGLIIISFCLCECIFEYFFSKFTWSGIYVDENLLERFYRRRIFFYSFCFLSQLTTFLKTEFLCHTFFPPQKVSIFLHRRLVFMIEVLFIYVWFFLLACL